MRVSHIFQLCLVFSLVMFVIACPQKAFAKFTLHSEISSIYPSLDQGEIDPEMDMEILKLILFEMDKSFEFQDDLASFYAGRNFQPLWVSGNRQSKAFDDMLFILGESWSHGLNPQKYDVRFIKSMVKSNLWQTSSIHRMIVELTMSDAVARLTHDMTSIRVNPRLVNIDESHWREPKDPKVVLESIAQSNKAEKAFNTLKPNNALYEELHITLKKEVNDLVLYGHHDERLETSKDIMIKPETNHWFVPKLRKHVMNLHGINGESQSTFYDSYLVHLVKQLQRRHSIVEDGIIGSETLSILNKDRLARIDQLIVNMERLRWIDFDRPDKYIVVNVPSARLWAIEGGDVAHQMPVVVGRKDRPTISFVASVKGVRFNPKWTIPNTIKVHDFLPKIQKNPDILKEKNISVYDGYGAQATLLDPESIDWDGIPHSELRGLNMVQQPGDDNPLGHIRFLMFNDYNIYLHDTNDHSSFSRSFRGQSSGCVRLSDPIALTEFLMGDHEEWGLQKIEQTIAHSEEQNILIKDEVPVYILYQTIWFEQNGALIYGPDMYDYDANLIQLLRHNDAIFIPDGNIEHISGLLNQGQKG